jgi:hypothetical protein
MTLTADSLPESTRRAVFAALVQAQDDGMPVGASRAAAGARFGIPTTEVVRIEREGLDGQWPPLGPRD